jgi:hypothetical protein
MKSTSVRWPSPVSIASPFGTSGERSWGDAPR